MNQLKTWMIGGQFEADDSSATSRADKKVEKEEKKEEKKEVIQTIIIIQRETYDIELTSFDAAKKITLIKEVRALLNLGLKDVNKILIQAKDLVEKAPFVIMKGVKKAETEKILTKLSENGGILKLV